MLSRSVTYALRLLIRLAAASPGQWMMGRDLARETGVPSSYLSKILLTLRNRGLVVAVRGQGGGYRLNRAADRIRLVDVVRIYGAQREREPCILDLRRSCTPQARCPAHEAFVDLRSDLGRVLDETTLADLVASGQPDLPPGLAGEGIEARAAGKDGPGEARRAAGRGSGTGEGLEAKRKPDDKN